MLLSPPISRRATSSLNQILQQSTIILDGDVSLSPAPTGVVLVGHRREWAIGSGHPVTAIGASSASGTSGGSS